jgi:ketosteroid isomerase-like protein
MPNLLRFRMLVFATFVIFPLLSSAQDAPARQQVELAERAGGRAAFMKDFATLSKYWSPELLVNSPGNRILTRDQVYAAIREDKLKYSNYKNEVEAFHVYADTAVIMGHESLTPDTGPEAGTNLYRRYTDIMQRSGDSWVLIARQATYTDDKQKHYADQVK